MPSLYTHYKFGKDVLKKLSKKEQKRINKEVVYYNIFNQGYDNLFYYYSHFKYYKRLGLKAHKKKVDYFFQEMINYLKQNNLNNDYTLTNIFYGFLNHYILDTLIHPFINAQVKNLNIPHTTIEYRLDSQIIKNNDIPYKQLIPRLKFDNKVIDFIDYIFENTYNEKNIGKIINKSHNNSYYLYRFFIYDKYGFKTLSYKIIDFIIPFKKFKLQNYTLYPNNFNTDILNKKKLIWPNPQNEEEKYNYSYDELYDLALKVAIKLHKTAFLVLNNKKDIQEFLSLLKLVKIKNISVLLSQ